MQYMDGEFKTLVRDAKQRHETAVELTYTRPCPICDAILAMTQTGVVSTGRTLEHGYTPDFGEIIRNRYMHCAACGFDQGS